MRRIVLATVLLAAAVRAETVTLPATANAGISQIRPSQKSGAGQLHLSYGAGETLRIRQNQNWAGFENQTILLKFDLTAIRGWTVKQAFLHIAMAKDDLYGVGACTILSDWKEPGVDAAAEAGAPCWNFRASPPEGGKPGPENEWAWPRSTFCSVTWLHPALRYHNAGPDEIVKSTDANGVRWIKVPVDPAIVHAMAIDASYGLVVTDDKGQVAEANMLEKNPKPYTYDPSFEMQVFTRRAKNGAGPKLEISGAPEDKTPPGAVADLKLAGVEEATGIATLKFTAPGDDGETGRAHAYRVTATRENTAVALPRYTLPLPVTAGQRQSLRLETLRAPGKYAVGIVAVDEAGNASPAATLEVNVPAAAPRRFAPATELKRSAAHQPYTPDEKLTIWAAGDLYKVDPVSGALTSSAKIDDPEAFQRGNFHWDANEKTVRLRAARNEVAACQLILQRNGPPLKDMKISIDDLRTQPGAVIESVKYVEFFRVWYVNAPLPAPAAPATGAAPAPRWTADACLPLAAPFGETFSIPWAENVGEAQMYQAIWVDVYVPKNAKAGDYAAKISIASPDLQQAATLTLEVAVRPFALPDEISWPVELNTYTGIAAYSGLSQEREPDRYLAAERRYYQLAHKHRLTMNILRYTHGGRITEKGAPPLEGEGAERHVSGWKEWDARFAQYLDGTAFSEAAGYDGPGRNTPVTHFYLPCHENWPLEIDPYYKDSATFPDRASFAEWSKKSRRLEKVVDEAYVKGYTRVVAEMVKHFEEQKWTRTGFMFFLNNKYYYKCPFFVEERHGMGGSSGKCYWLLDEPVDFDDMDANRYFLALCKRGAEASGARGVKLQYRTDVSNPHMVRGLWDGLCNVWCCSFTGEVVSTSLARQKWMPEEKWWNYGAGIGIADAPAGFHHLFLNRYSWGATGVLPYWTNYGERDWRKANNMNIYYSGQKYAGTEKHYDGPLPGLRMKLMRRAQQDVEYLNLLARCRGWNRDQVVHALGRRADENTPEWGLKFSKLSEEDLEQLREDMAASIEDAGAPE